jgi:hypothetical protein
MMGKGMGKGGMGRAKGYGKGGTNPGTGGPMPPATPGMGRGYKDGGMVKPKGKK